VRPAIVELELDAEPDPQPESVSMLPTSHSAPDISGLVTVRRAPSDSIARVAMLAAAVLVAGVAVGVAVPRLSANAPRREEAPLPTAASTAQTPPAPEPEGTAAAQAPEPSAAAPAPEPAAEPPAEPPEETAAPPDPIPPNVGELQMPPSAAGHRIFVDGRTVSEGTDPVRVPCGAHAVRIGSAGRLQQIDVPCGSALSLTR
jgi:hypothetical protein